MSIELATYIDDLQPQWPASTDAVSAGDDHIRLIKAVLQNTFPNISGPVTASDVSLSRGAIPLASITVFYQASAPAGWTRVDPAASSSLRVVPTGSPGGITGGSDDPILNAKIPAHYHAISFTSGDQNVNHQHDLKGWTKGESYHTHSVNLNTSSVSVVTNQGSIPSGGAAGNAALTGANAGTHYHTVSGKTSAGGTHVHELYGLSTGDQTVSHAHEIKGDSATPTITEIGGTLGTWRPRYLDVILCRRTS